MCVRLRRCYRPRWPMRAVLTTGQLYAAWPTTANVTVILCLLSFNACSQVTVNASSLMLLVISFHSVRTRSVSQTLLNTLILSGYTESCYGCVWDLCYSATKWHPCSSVFTTHQLCHVLYKLWLVAVCDWLNSDIFSNNLCWLYDNRWLLVLWWL